MYKRQMFRRLQKRANGLIKLVDVAPEEPGNLDFIRECHNEVRISIAHTCTCLLYTSVGGVVDVFGLCDQLVIRLHKTPYTLTM